MLTGAIQVAVADAEAPSRDLPGRSPVKADRRPERMGRRPEREGGGPPHEG
jgi:hypothetical protein